MGIDLINFVWYDSDMSKRDQPVLREWYIERVSVEREVLDLVDPATEVVRLIDAARMLDVSLPYVSQQVAGKLLPVVRKEGSGSRYLLRADVERLAGDRVEDEGG